LDLRHIAALSSSKVKRNISVVKQKLNFMNNRQLQFSHTGGQHNLVQTQNTTCSVRCEIPSLLQRGAMTGHLLPPRMKE
jgi:hypothetical protein